jgi:hypothetical protein
MTERTVVQRLEAEIQRAEAMIELQEGVQLQLARSMRRQNLYLGVQVVLFIATALCILTK